MGKESWRNVLYSEKTSNTQTAGKEAPVPSAKQDEIKNGTWPQ